MGDVAAPITADIVLTSSTGNWNPSAVLALNYSGVDQSNPIGSTNGANAASGTDVTVDLTTDSNNSVVVGGATGHGADTNPYDPDAPPLPDLTERVDTQTGTATGTDAGVWAGDVLRATAGPFTFNVTASVSDDWAIAVAEMHAAGCISDLECASLDDQCNVGVCSAGQCVAQPRNQGLSCDDSDTCTTGETCSAGVCGGGTSSCPITFDNASSSSSSADTLDFSHTIGGGGDRLLVVCTAVEGPIGSADVTGNITYNGVTMTKAIDNITGTSFDQNTEIWYMLDADIPPAGTYTVSVTVTGSDNITAGAVSVTGAQQQPVEATAFNDDGQSGASSIQTNITTLTDGAWIFDCVGSGNAITGFTPDAGQTERWDTVASSSRGASSTEIKATAGLATLGWTVESASNRISHVLAAFAPAPIDSDGDGVADALDNCPSDFNPSQTDTDGDGIGDACDACPNDAQNDTDGDGVCGDVDNCPTTANPAQTDTDADGLGDACDACPNDAQNDTDGDGVCGDVDNCPNTANPAQADADADGLGDACDACPNDA
ncbi:MAG: hypothetical protein E2O71_01970, partial [Deltaproteobacteria bacterium]